MDARTIEAFVERRLRQAVGKRVRITRGPVVLAKSGALRPEIFIHAANLEDFKGVTADGAHTTRRPAKGPGTFWGYQEERPGRIVLVVSCMAGTYETTQELCKSILPAALLSLETLPRTLLGSLLDDSVHIHFDDFVPSLYSAEFGVGVNEGNSIYSGRLVFHLDGFIHVWVTKRGGLSRQSTGKAAIPATKRVSKSPVRIKKKSAKR